MLNDMRAIKYFVKFWFLKAWLAWLYYKLLTENNKYKYILKNQLIYKNNNYWNICRLLLNFYLYRGGVNANIIYYTFKFIYFNFISFIYSIL